METIECKHREQIRSLGHGVELGTCSVCHQEVQYHMDKLKDSPTVTKLGRIDGRLVLPNHNYKLLLEPQEQADLAAAQLWLQRAKAPEKKEPKARLKFYRENKGQMIEDLLNLDTKAFLEKWQVSPQTISHLRSDKLYKKLAQVPGAAPKARAPRPKLPSGDKLPQLPPWSDNWAPEVQVRWLDVYEKVLAYKSLDID